MQAIVFTKAMGPEAMDACMRGIAELSAPVWQGDWHPGHSHDDGRADGFRTFVGRVPVVACRLDRLAADGPHGPIWWRYGHQELQTLTDALDDPDDHRAYTAREKQRRADATAARERRQQERDEERRRREATAWLCPECGRRVYPAGDEWSDGAEPGGVCGICQSGADHDTRQAQEEAAEQAALERQTRSDGWRGWLGR
ncbi:hypothetical protein AB0N09_43320 [Streptomyces erythrochromogenes]|uniref:hypothetical protein n=1 Tax=Streptomyces erythrochromogenes TaxID=285574 RepID=UPI00344AAEB4